MEMMKLKWQFPSSSSLQRHRLRLFEEKLYSQVLWSPELHRACNLLLKKEKRAFKFSEPATGMTGSPSPSWCLHLSQTPCHCAQSQKATIRTAGPRGRQLAYAFPTHAGLVFSRVTRRTAETSYKKSGRISAHSLLTACFRNKNVYMQVRTQRSDTVLKGGGGKSV